MTPTKIHLLTSTPIGILMVFCDRLWQFRILTPNGGIFGHTSDYYTAAAAEAAGREWVGSSW